MSSQKRKAPDTPSEEGGYGARRRIIAANPSAVILNENPVFQEEEQDEPLTRPPRPPQINVPVITVPMTTASSATTTTQSRMDDGGVPNPPDRDIPLNILDGASRGGVVGYPGQAPVGMSRRRKRYAGFSRRSFKFLRWLYHIRKKRRFTPAQQANAHARRAVFFRAWKTAREQGRRYLTGADVKAAQGTVASLPSGRGYF